MKNRHPLVLLLIALLFVGMGIVLSIGVKLGLESAGIKETLTGRILQSTAQIALISWFYSIYRRKFEGKSLHEDYPPKGAPSRIGAGLAAGAGLITLLVAVQAVAGSYTIVSFQFSPDVLKYMLLMIIIGFIEELVTRGIIFRLVEKWAGSLVALAVVSIEGALTHATNPNATLWSSMAVGLEFGVFVTLVYMATRNLWTVSALHFAWNFTMGGIFGINVSGTDAAGLVTAETSGPAWLTGGEFGLEAGTPAVLLTGVISILLAVRLVKNGSMKKYSHSK